MGIEIKRLSDSEVKEMGIDSWPIWEKEVSVFDWYYDQTEDCLLLEGKVTVETKAGEKVEFGKDDFVTFPKGLSCTWNIKQPVKKHYRFR